MGFQDRSSLQVKSIAQHSAILSTFIKLPFAINTFILSISEWSLKTGFTEAQLHTADQPTAPRRRARKHL